MHTLRSIGILAAALSLAPCGTPAATMPLPSPPADLNPFCAVRPEIEPLNVPQNAYRLRLVSEAPGKEVSAHVTLAGVSGLYDVVVKRSELQGAPYDQRSAPLVVTFAQPVAIDYAYVSAYYVDDAPQRACPALVVPVRGDDKSSEPGAAASGSVPATFVKPLPALPCGKLYTPVRIVKAARPEGFVVDSPPVEEYSYKYFKMLAGSDIDQRSERTAAVLVDLDDQGAVVQTTLLAAKDKSTIVASLTAAQESTYAPATFLCEPTVGDYIFELDMGAK